MFCNRLNWKCQIICIFVLVACCAAVMCMSSAPPSKPSLENNSVTVFLTGNTLGKLQPCGCAAGQLGGIDRRKAIFDKVAPGKRMIVDTGSFVEKPDEQGLIKFNIEVEALSLLNYDVVNLTKEDIEISRKLGILEGLGAMVNVISSQRVEELQIPSKFTKHLLLKDRTLPVSVVTFDSKSRPIEELEEVFAKGSRPFFTVNILILNHCDSEIQSYISKMRVVDCVVCPSDADEAGLLSNPGDRPMIVSVGKYGKYIGKLRITSPNAGEKHLSFSSAAVTEDILQDQLLVGLYKDYQQLVKGANLLERNPRFSLSEGLKYSGSQACKMCHLYEYKKWSGKKHAHAYNTLENVGSQYDPECVTCHVVGYDYEGGFVSKKKTNHLKDVGCENCHGPGSKHIESKGELKLGEPKSACTDCHTSERSKYIGNEQKYFKKIIHWREPNIADNVKREEKSEY